MKNSAFLNLTYGLFVVTTRDGGRDNGCVTNTVIQVTTDPNRIAVAVNKSNRTHDMICRSGVMNVSILSEKASFETFVHWGFRSGAEVDKTIGVELSRAENGVVYVTEGVNGVISARVAMEVDLGTHTLFVADVVDDWVLNDDASATYAFYHAHIKPKREVRRSRGWICTVCGYVYEGEEIPEDFECPVCGHPASDFERVE